MHHQPDEKEQRIRTELWQLDRGNLSPDMEAPTEPPTYGPRDLSLRHPPSLEGAGVRLPLNKEPSGTRTWLTLTGLMIEALKEGGIFMVDELDARLHPTLAGRNDKIYRVELKIAQKP